MIERATVNLGDKRAYEAKKELLLKSYDRNTEFRFGDEIRCKRCKEAKTFDDSKYGIFTRCLCKCDSEKFRAQEQKTRLATVRQKYDEVAQAAFDLGSIYARAAFHAIDVRDVEEKFINNAERCETYCTNFDVFSKKGRGLWLFGGNGVGKTYIAACIYHRLSEDKIPAIFTSAERVCALLRSSFSKNATLSEMAIVESLSKVDCLFIDRMDGLPTGRREAETYTVRRFADIIRARLENGKPTVFVSREPLDAFAQRDIFPDDVLDLLASKTSQLILTGKNRRLRRDV